MSPDPPVGAGGGDASGGRPPTAPQREEHRGPTHAWPGKLLVAVMALGGLGALLAAVWSLFGPPPGTVRMFGLRGRGWMLTAFIPRLAMAAFGTALLVSSWGLVAWRRWAWWSSVGFAALFGLGFLAQLLAPMWGGAPASALDLYALLYVVCLPYLIRNRRFFQG